MSYVESSPHYKEALQKLFLRNSNPKLGLSRIGALLESMGFKRDEFTIIQIVGTNGKGSTSAFCESLLLTHKKSCALFTSPHLSSARERIRINGEMVSEQVFSDAVSVVLEKADLLSDEPSFFECLLAMFVFIAKKAKVEVLIAEAGLGGRLDATTALKAHALGLAMVDIDHQNVLGESLEEIAREKISAAYTGQQLISVKQHEKVRAVLEIMQKERAFTLSYAPSTLLPLGLIGEHQKINAGLALALVKSIGLELQENAVSEGLNKVNWPGRYEKINHDGVKIIFDGAHNPSGMRALNAALKQDESLKESKLMVIFGSLKSATTEEKVALLLEYKFEEVFIHVSENPRRESYEDLCEIFFKNQVSKDKVFAFSSWDEILLRAQKSRATVLVCGSLYSVGELRAKLLGLHADHLLPNY